MSDDRRNIVIITTDQQRHDELGCLDPRLTTPSLDGLVSSGTRFSDAYASSTICAPSRGSMITGQLPHKYPGSTPYRRQSRSLREGAWTAPRALQLSGYATAMIGKGHFRPMRSDHGYGHVRLAEPLDEYEGHAIDDYVAWLVHNGRGDHRATHIFGPDDDEERRRFREALNAGAFEIEEKYHSTAWVRDEAIEFVRTRDQAKPFLLTVSFPKPHAPFDPPQRWLDRVDPSAFGAVDHVEEASSGLPDIATEFCLGTHGFPLRRTDELDEQVIANILASRAALIMQIDDAVGSLLEEIPRDETVVCFTSDHGDYAGRRGLLMKTPFIPFDDLARVPFVWSGPGIEAGRTIETPVQNFDMAMTMLDIAEQKVLGLDGANLTSVLEGGDADPGRAVFTDSVYMYRMMRVGSVKFFHHETSGEEMAFDLAADPGERVNIVDDPKYASTIATLRQTLERTMLQGQMDLPHE